MEVKEEQENEDGFGGKKGKKQKGIIRKIKRNYLNFQTQKQEQEQNQKQEQELIKS